MVDTRLVVPNYHTPLVNPDGTGTPYLLRLLSQLLREKGITDGLAEGAATAADLATLQAQVDAMVLDDLDDVDTTTNAPADGDILVFDNASGDWLPEAPSSGGGSFVFIERVTVTADATVDIPLSDTYDSFYLEYYFTPSTDNIETRLRVTEDNFATVKSGASDYGWAQTRSNTSTGVSQSDGLSYILLVTGQGNAAGEFTSGLINVLNAKETAPTRISHLSNYVSITGVHSRAGTEGAYKANAVVDGIRIFPSGGTLTGFYKLWGRLAA
jgi:hypothetical protein